jgi:ATP synthase protein I
MASNGKDLDPGRGMLSPEERDALKQRASDLGKRLDEVHARKAPPLGDAKSRGNALGQAFKILTELIVGVVVGGGIGWVLDRQFGTKPWLLLLFLLVGFAAGMSNVIRSARRMQAQAEPLQRASPSVTGDDDEDDPPPVSRAPPSTTGGRQR